MTSKAPLGFDEPQSCVSLSRNSVVVPVASWIVSVALSPPQVVGQVPPTTVTLLMRISWLSRSSRIVV